MTAARKLIMESHVVDILGSTRGRDQPIMLMDRAFELISMISPERFSSENTVFIDPFCKAGELLLATAMRYCQVNSKQRNRAYSDAEIAKLIYSKKFFGLAPDERHFLLTKRTFLGNYRSHQLDFEQFKNGNYLSEIDGKLNKEIFEKELNKMIDLILKQNKSAKIVAIGNPPYQESDEGFGGSATAIYNHFAEALMNSKEIAEFVIVIPSRWFSAGKGTEDFRSRIIASKEIKAIRHFKQSKEVFPTVDVLGGVCFLHYKSGYSDKTIFIEGDLKSEITLSKFDIIPDDALAYPIIDKIQKKWSGQYVSDIAWSGKPFGIRTFYFKRNSEASGAGTVFCYAKGRKRKKIKRSAITKNADRINEYKVAVPRAYAPGSKLGVRRVTLPLDQYFIIPKGEICAETYNIVGSFESKREAQNFLEYLKTDFARYLLGLRKITQDIPKDRWNWVPLVSMEQRWDDQLLFDLFGISKQEQAHLRKKVQEWS